MASNDVLKSAQYKHYDEDTKGWVVDAFETVADNVYLANGYTVEEQMYFIDENIADAAMYGMEAQVKINSLEKEIEDLKQALSERSYVGMIIESTTLDTQSKVIAFYGGTQWKKIEGKFLFGCDLATRAGSTGGKASVELTVNQMPSHVHSGQLPSHSHNLNLPLHRSDKEPKGVDHGLVPRSVMEVAYPNRVAVYASDQNVSAPNPATSFTTSSAGYGQAHENMPPYLSVYIWQRTA